MNDNSTQSVRSVRDVRAQVESLFADWIRINDNKSQYTLDDFPYDGGVPDQLEKHCWRCITVNHCWFVDQQDKKPEEFGYEKYTAEQIPAQMRGLYHPHCHCRKEEISAPSVDSITVIILKKFDNFFSRKNGIYYGMGYTDNDKEEFVKLICQMVKEYYALGNYTLFEHDNAGFKINIPLDVPGKGIKEGHTYKIKSGWAIFPDGKLKANTIFAGWRPRK